MQAFFAVFYPCACSSSPELSQKQPRGTTTVKFTVGKKTKDYALNDERIHTAMASIKKIAEEKGTNGPGSRPPARAVLTVACTAGIQPNNGGKWQVTVMFCHVLSCAVMCCRVMTCAVLWQVVPFTKRRRDADKDIDNVHLALLEAVGGMFGAF